MIEAGVFAESLRLELLGGRLFPKRTLSSTMTRNDPHNFVVRFLGMCFDRLVGPEWFAWEEKSVVLGRFWRPEPDIAIVRGPLQQYRMRAPRPADLGLLVEVSEASYARDRGVKWRKYAASGVATCWIVNLAQKRIEVYSRPSGEGQAAAYQDSRIYEAADEVPVLLDGRERGRIPVREVIG